MNLITTRTPTTATTTPATCPGCEGALEHCHETLVLHADGTAECEGFPACDLDPACHELWMVCADLATCGCTGDDDDLVHELPLAA